ncbi:MAG TPA: phosphatase PAP2 family protein [Flavobacteriales bacterium]|nr:phosphatase PAP2 family protein [Flavobacteriales bacterium]
MHPYFKARDFSAFIFPLTYIPVVIFILFNLKRTERLNFFMMGYCLLVLTRMAGIYFLPLCEPEGAIALHDYLLNNLFYPGGYCAVDLFYSGHTATLFLLALVTPKPWKYSLLALTAVLGLLVIWQKVHYTIDVMAAIPITFICYLLAKKLYYFTSKEKYTAR